MANHDPDARPLLLGGPALALRLFFLAALAAGLMVADHRQHRLAAIRSAMSAVVFPFQWAVQAPVQAWTTTRESLATRAQVDSDNVRLAADNLMLRLKLMRYESIEQENKRLRAASASTSRVVQRTLLAEVVLDYGPFRQRVLVNKGTSDGVFRGQAALDAQGVYGQVTRVGPVSAELILISDTESAVPVLVNRTGARTIAEGLGWSGLLSLPYLPQNSDVVAGDLLVSSGLGGVYPPGYPVGKVTEVLRDTAKPLLAVKAEPLARLDSGPEVLLVWFDNKVVEPDVAPEPETIAQPVQKPPAARPASPQPAPARPAAIEPESAPSLPTTPPDEAVPAAEPREAAPQTPEPEPPPQ